MATRLATAAQNAACDAVVDLIDDGGAGTIQIRTGAQPASANDAATGTLLGTLTFTDVPAAFGDASAGVATAASITGDNSADANGTAGWFRVLSGAGATIFDGNITANGGGGDMELNNINITATGTIDVTAFTFTIPASE